MESLVIVGPGRVGLSLGAALLQERQVERLTYYGRSQEPPPHPLFDSQDPPVEYRVGIQVVPEGTSALLLTVPDAALSEVAMELAMAGRAPAGCVALHVSGALSAEVLTPLHTAGYAVGSFHPLQSLADPWAASERLIGATFALAGEPPAVVTGRRLASALGGRTIVVSARDRALYHAAAVAGSNYVVALYASAARMMQQAGVGTDDASVAVLGLMRGTLDNLEHLGPSAALTGPIARGDVETVRLHLARLSPRDRGLYCALGRVTLELARAAGLADERAAELDRLLSDDNPST